LVHVDLHAWPGAAGLLDARPDPSVRVVVRLTEVDQQRSLELGRVVEQVGHTDRVVRDPAGRTLLNGEEVRQHPAQAEADNAGLLSAAELAKRGRSVGDALLRVEPAHV